MPIRSEKPARLPVVLTRHRVYIFPTRQGLVFLLVLIAMLAGSVNYNNNLGFLLVFLLGAMALVSMIHTWRNLLGLHIPAFSAAPVFAGENALFCLLLRSPDAPRKAVSVSVGKHPPACKDIPLNRDETFAVAVPTVQRGVLRPGWFTVSTVYPTGLFCAWVVLDSDIGITVYPAPAAGPEALRGGAGGGDGDRNGQGYDDPGDFRGLKSYQPGDSFQHIAWKALSRGQGVYIKDFSGDKSRSAPVFDFAELHEESTEMRLSRLSAMIVRASRAKIRYGLALPGKVIEPASGSDHRHRCLKALALFEENGFYG